MSDNAYQKKKKNSNRVKSKDRALHSSIQRNYAKPKEENRKQLKLL